MVNKPFWHISDFVLASYIFGCVKMSDFVPNNHHLREVLIFFFHSKKTAAQAHRELQKVYEDAALSATTCRDWFLLFNDRDFDVDDFPREGRPKTLEDADVIYYELLKPNDTITGKRYRTQLMRLSRALREKRSHYEQRHEKWYHSMTTLGLTLPNPLKPTWKRSNGKFHPTRRIPQILRRPITTCSGWWHMVWLISSSAHMKTSKNGLTRGWPQKMNTFTVTVFELYQEYGQKM